MTSVGLVIVNGRGDAALKKLISNSNLERFSEIVVVNVGKTKIQKTNVGLQNLTIVDSHNTLCVNINRLVGATHLLNSDYIIFLDDDDVIDGKEIPPCLDRSVYIVGGQVYDKNQNRLRDLRNLTERTEKMCLWGGFSRAIVSRNLAIRELVNVTHMVSFQDQALWIAMSSAGLKPDFIDGTIVQYFLNSSSISTKPWRAIYGFLQLLAIIAKNAPSLIKHGVLIMCIIGTFRALIKRLLIRNIFK